MTDTETLALCHADNVPVRMLNALIEAGASTKPWSYIPAYGWLKHCKEPIQAATLDDLDGLLGKCVRVLGDYVHIQNTSDTRLKNSYGIQVGAPLATRTYSYGPTPHHAAVAALEAANKEGK